MDYYYEYPIRCFKCGYIIDGYSQDYETLVLKGYERKEAFEELGISAKMACCRESMMNPVKVYFNMQVDVVVHGIVEAEYNVDNSIKPDDYISRFGSCLDTMTGSKVKYNTIEIKHVEVENLFDEPDEFLPLTESEGSIEPTEPGMPVINSTTRINKKIKVGAGKSTIKLNGRTYMAV